MMLNLRISVVVFLDTRLRIIVTDKNKRKYNLVCV